MQTELKPPPLMAWVDGQPHLLNVEFPDGQSTLNLSLLEKDFGGYDPFQVVVFTSADKRFTFRWYYERVGGLILVFAGNVVDKVIRREFDADDVIATGQILSGHRPGAEDKFLRDCGVHPNIVKALDAAPRPITYLVVHRQDLSRVPSRKVRDGITKMRGVNDTISELAVPFQWWATYALYKCWNITVEK